MQLIAKLADAHRQLHALRQELALERKKVEELCRAQAHLSAARLEPADDAARSRGLVAWMRSGLRRLKPPRRPTAGGAHRSVEPTANTEPSSRRRAGGTDAGARAAPEVYTGPNTGDEMLDRLISHQLRLARAKIAGKPAGPRERRRSHASASERRC